MSMFHQHGDSHSHGNGLRREDLRDWRALRPLEAPPGMLDVA